VTIDRESIIRQVEANRVYQGGRKKAARGSLGGRTAKDAWSMQQNIALRLAKGQLPVRPSPSGKVDDGELARDLLEATTVWWSTEIFEAATNASFDDVAYHPAADESSPSFWLLDSFAPTSAFPIFALALIPKPPNATVVVPIGRDAAGIVPIEIRYGASRVQHREQWKAFADQVGAPALASAADLCFRALVLGTAFLESSYIPKKREDVGKPSRKDSVRDRRAASSHDVTIVNLRYAMAENGEEPLGDAATESERRAHSHRWIVSGHFRNQAYGPEHSLRKVIWVPAHVKGPEDAPLSKTVYRAVR